MCLTCAEAAVRNERSKRQQTVQVSAVLARHRANVSSAVCIHYFNLCFVQWGGDVCQSLHTQLSEVLQYNFKSPLYLLCMVFLPKPWAASFLRYEDPFCVRKELVCLSSHCRFFACFPHPVLASSGHGLLFKTKYEKSLSWQNSQRTIERAATGAGGDAAGAAAAPPDAADAAL